MLRNLIITMCLLVKVVSASDFLPSWQAFQVTVAADGHQAVWVKFNIAPEYHIYQNKIKIKTLAGSSVALAQPIWPEPVVIKSPDLGSFLVYENNTAIQVPISNYGNGQLKVQISYQGCKGLDLCFPEQQTQLQLDLTKAAALPVTLSAAVVTEQPADKSAAVQSATVTADNSLTSLIKNTSSSQQVASFFQNNLWLIVSGFFVLGLLIAFTPCVFPLLPILLSLVAGTNISPRRSFSLALSYILGGAVVYAVAGVVAASLGYSFTAALQATWLNLVLSALFAFFAVALFAGINLQLPAALQTWLNHKIKQRNDGSILNSFFIGGIANLVLSPCVTAPLAGALLYITSSGNKLLGAAALFALGLGSGLPLLVIAVFGKQILPKNGAWMSVVKQFLALLMLGMAIYMLSKVVNPLVINYLLLLWLIGVTSLLIAQLKIKLQLRYGAGMVVALLLIGVAVGPLALLSEKRVATNFIRVTTQQQLEQALATAQPQPQPVMLDYYAGWCIACKEMELRTFTNPLVNNLLKSFTVIRVDVSENNQDSRDLQQRYSVIAPPSLVFLTPKGAALDAFKVTGFIAADKLQQNLGLLLKQQCTPASC